MEALQGQTRNLDVAVRELRSQQDRLLQIKEHDAERYACVSPGSPSLHSLNSMYNLEYHHCSGGAVGAPVNNLPA